MSGVTWNDGDAGGLHNCDRCNEPNELPCRICDRDGIEMREPGLCEQCAKGLDLVEEAAQ